METVEMGRVTCKIRVENAIDTARVRMGEIPATAVRSVELPDALVDTGATTLALPATLVQRLGLDGPTAVKRSRNPTGEHQARMFGPARLWIEDRDMVLDVLEVADGCPALVGQIPLEFMQMVVDMANHRVTKSTTNGGEWVLDMF